MIFCELSFPALTYNLSAALPGHFALAVMNNSDNSGEWGVLSVWMLANISYAGMRAQNTHHLWRIVAFVFGFPGTILSWLVVTEGSEKAYGIELPRHKTGNNFVTNQASTSQEIPLNPGNGLSMQRSGQFIPVIAWAAVCLLCLYCLVAFLNLRHAVSAFELLINHMPVALPDNTKLLLATWPWGHAALLITACISAIIKEFLTRNKERSIVLTSVVAIFVLLVVNWSNAALLAPFTSFINKIIQ
jgi:hypothetical protein